jgi:hypothetical protein
MGRRDQGSKQDAVLRTLYRDFLYLNGVDTLNALASLQGGEVVELVQKVGQETEGGFNFGLALHFVQAGASGKKAKHVEQEVRLRQNEHAAIGHLLSALAEVAERSQPDGLLNEGDVGELAGEAVLIRADSVVAAETARAAKAKVDREARGWWQRSREEIWPAPVDDELERQHRFAAKGVGETFMVIVAPDQIAGSDQKPVVVPCERRWLHCSPQDVHQRLGRRVRVVGKVEARGDVLLVESGEAMAWKAAGDGVTNATRPPEIRLRNGSLEVERGSTSAAGHESADQTEFRAASAATPELPLTARSRSELVYPAPPDTGGSDAAEQREWNPLTNRNDNDASSDAQERDVVPAYLLTGATVVRPLCIYR